MALEDYERAIAEAETSIRLWEIQTEIDTLGKLDDYEIMLIRRLILRRRAEITGDTPTYRGTHEPRHNLRPAHLAIFREVFDGE